MFSPVFDDVTGLFGRPMNLSSFAPSATTGEVAYAPHGVVGSGDAQARPAPGQPYTTYNTSTTTAGNVGSQFRPSFSFADGPHGTPHGAPLHLAPQPPPSPPMMRADIRQHGGPGGGGHTMSMPRQAMQYPATEMFSGTPYEVYLPPSGMTQQHQQAILLQTTDGVRYVLANTATGAHQQMVTHVQPSFTTPGMRTITTAPTAGATYMSYPAPSAAQHTTGTTTTTGNLNLGDYGFFSIGGPGQAPTYTVMTTAGGGGVPMMSGGPGTGQRHAYPGIPGGLPPNTTTAAHLSRDPSVAEQLSGKSFVEVFDPDFKYIYEVPSTSVAHLPPTRLNITRLVLCRNYRPCEPQSCAMGGNCKFVHADCDCARLEAHPIHVNYIWRHESLCTYPRLQAGGVLRVTGRDGQVSTVAAEKVLMTNGAAAALKESTAATPTAPAPVLLWCESYDASGMCHQGERCTAIHRLTVDPNVQGDFKRAPRRRDSTLPTGATSGPARMEAASASTTSEPPLLRTQSCSSAEQSHVHPPEPASATTPETSSSDAKLSTSESATPLTPAVATATAAAAENTTGATGTNNTRATMSYSLHSGTAALKLTEALEVQRRAAAPSSSGRPTSQLNHLVDGNSGGSSITLSMSPYAAEMLADASSMGTLLYLPRGATVATVLGPVKASSDASAAAVDYH